MSDYKRWISYIYFYDNNVKKNNIGYIRVETRGGNTKLTMHINVLSVTEPMNVYLFIRDGGKIRGINIGVISMEKGVGHGVYNTETDNIMNTGHCISDVGGVILFHKKDKFYASEWDDSVIDIEKFEDFNQEQIAETAEDVQDDISVHQGKDMDEAKADEEQQRSRSYEVEDGLDESVTDNEKDIQSEEDNGAADITDAADTFTGNGETANENLNNAVVENAAAEAADAPVIEAMENGKDAGLSDEIVMAAENILHTYPYMYPFENDDIDACVRIEPQDISNLPIDTWLISNNSFLLKGYYGYRHLIFIKMGKTNPRYMIGVPGINHNRENFLANMFGFKLFKPIKNTSDVRGEFGYWCISISGR